MDNQLFTLLGISLVIVRNSKGQYLTVLENGNQGWWVPGGLVDPPETYQQAAVRETKEEASIDVQLLGVLRIEQSIKKEKNYQRCRTIFYAQPIDENQPPKSKPDKETQRAQYVDFKSLPELGNGKPGWRGPELLEWAEYIENGGMIMPMRQTIHSEGFTYKIQMKKQLNAENSYLLGLSLVVVRNKNGQYLAVLENKKRGWWLPGGRVDPPESYQSAAVRETKEEAGIDVELKGVLRLEYWNSQQFNRFKIVFYAQPKDEQQVPKQVKDKESQMAKWINYKDLEEIGNSKDGWRGPELLEWSEYIESGGMIMPMSILGEEGEKVQLNQKPFYLNDLPN